MWKLRRNAATSFAVEEQDRGNARTSPALVVNFGGVVHPQAGNWRIYGPVDVRRESADLIISLLNSCFSVRVVAKNSPESDSDLQEYLTRLWYDTDSVVMSVLDALGFCLAAPLQLQLITGSIDGKDALIGAKTSMDDLSVAEGDEVTGDRLGPFLCHSITNANVRHALADIRMAMSFTDDCFFYCYRAVESMRQHYFEDPGASDDGPDRKRSWERLRKALDVDESSLQALHAKANERRHGRDASSEFKERHEAVKMTRGLLSKFIASLPPPPPMPTFDA